MTTKTTKKARPKPIKPASPRKSPQIEILPTDSEEVIASKYASMVASPELAAYRVINGAEIKSGIGDALDVPALMDQLREQAAAVRGGNMGNPEAMLMNQATALQSLFARLAERGMGAKTRCAFETNMRYSPTGAVAMSGNAGNAGRDQESADCLCPASERDNRAATNQQWHGATDRGRGKSKASNPNYQGKSMSYYRTPEHRAMRAELIRRWKPWEKSTGPKSPEGKARISHARLQGRDAGNAAGDAGGCCGSKPRT